MITRARLKFMIAGLLVVATATAGLGFTRGAAQVIAFFQRGADPAAALHIEPNTPIESATDLTWQPDDNPVSSTPNPLIRGQLEAVYLRAWREWNAAALRGDPTGLASVFSGPALSAAQATIQANYTRGWRVTRVATRHELQLTYLSADGLIAGLSDREAIVTQIIRDESGQVLLDSTQRQGYTVVLMLEDGQWRIRHLQQTFATPFEPSLPETARCDTCVVATSLNNRPLLAAYGMPLLVNGINYYPQQTPWDRFWSEYNPAIIDQDFDRIRALGLNTVRIFIPFEQFGGPRVSRIMLDRLTDLLDRADLRGLYVIVTLFDFRTNYDPLLWPEADRHMQTLMQHYAGRPTILAWDLKNEPDLDYRHAGRPLVDAWLKHTLSMARIYAPGQLITIGWSSPGAATTLATQVDLVSFHYYAPAEQFPEQYAALQSAVPDRPLLLGEFGLPTWNSPFFPNGHTEAEQARYYAAILSALRHTESVGSLAWTLYDFAQVPAGVAGMWPWQTGPQREMGIVRLDGSPKPAAALLQSGADLNLPPAEPWERWLKPFWITVWILLALVGVFLGRMIVLRRGRARTPRPATPVPAQRSPD